MSYIVSTEWPKSHAPEEIIEYLNYALTYRADFLPLVKHYS
jgi:hypothetical protein